MRFTFIAQHPADDLKVTMEFEGDPWSEVLDQFKTFLLGCGYVLPKGALDFAPTPGGWPSGTTLSGSRAEDFETED